MDLKIIQGILIPFLGTSLGAACVLFMKKDLNIKIQKNINRFCSWRNGGSVNMESYYSIN